MFLIKIFHFLFGYDILSIKGNNKEKTISELIASGAKLSDIKSSNNEYTATISRYNSENILGVSGYEIKEKKGVPAILDKIMARKGFIIGICAVILGIFLGSQFIWTVEYEGTKDCNTEELYKAVQKAELKTGVLKAKLNTPTEMKNIILNNTDDICWCWVYIKGTKATVKVRKNIIPKTKIDLKIPCDIIAMRNGIIKKVIAKKGHITVKDNQAVTAGETIISGTYEFESEPGYQVHALGTAEALTEHTKSGIYRQYYCYKTYTGRKRRFLTLNLYKWKVPLYIKKRTGFDGFDEVTRTYGKYSGLGIEIREASEYKTVKEPISYDTTVELAKDQLEKEIAGELLEPATLVDKKIDTKKIDEETVEVTVTMYFTEQIGTEKQIEEVTFIEPKTNQSAGGD